MRLSVIIPAYNVENTLHRCVESVVAQQMEEMEVIIIDDGSTDSTGSMIDGLKEAHSDVIRVVHQENRGLSVARNIGIDMAQGEIITFVDSDDWVKAGTYAPLVAEMASHADWDILEYPVEKNSPHRQTEQLRFSNAVFTDIKNYWFATEGYSHCYAWNKLFRRHLFFPREGQGIRFEEGRTFEDTALMVSLLDRHLTIATSTSGCYVYELNPQGISSTANARAMAQLLAANTDALRLLGMTAERTLSRTEEDYYMSVVNIQITLCQMAHRMPTLPPLRVCIHHEDWRNPRRLVKKILLRLVGLKNMCKIFSLIHN